MLTARKRSSADSEIFFSCGGGRSRKASASTTILVKNQRFIVEHGVSKVSAFSMLLPQALERPVRKGVKSVLDSVLRVVISSSTP